MGIENIHILINQESDDWIRQAQAALEAQRIAEHRKGKHTFGNMRRDCPLCQAGK